MDTKPGQAYKRAYIQNGSLADEMSLTDSGDIPWGHAQNGAAMGYFSVLSIDVEGRQTTLKYMGGTGTRGTEWTAILSENLGTGMWVFKTNWSIVEACRDSTHLDGSFMYMATHVINQSSSTHL